LRGREIAKRYSRAFLEIAGEDAKYEEYYNELKSFSLLLNQNENLKGFMDNPLFAQSEKIAVLDEILMNVIVSPVTANFLKLLIQKKRISVLTEIEEYYQQYMDVVLDIVRVKVRSAYPLSDDLSEQIKARMEELTGKKVEMETEKDTSLLGGIVVRVGDTLYDGSIRAQLNSISELLREEI
jgi:F-type H+-transporting ATPase subunit delta